MSWLASFRVLLFAWSVVSMSPQNSRLHSQPDLNSSSNSQTTRWTRLPNTNGPLVEGYSLHTALWRSAARSQCRQPQSVLCTTSIWLLSLDYIQHFCCFINNILEPNTVRVGGTRWRIHSRFLTVSSGSIWKRTHYLVVTLQWHSSSVDIPIFWEGEQNIFIWEVCTSVIYNCQIFYLDSKNKNFIYQV